MKLLAMLVTVMAAATVSQALYYPGGGFQTQHFGYKPVSSVVNHRPFPVNVPVPFRVFNPVPVFRPVFSTALNRVPVPVRVRRPVPVPVPIDIPRPFPVYRPVDVVKPVPVQNHHFLLRKVGVPVSSVYG